MDSRLARRTRESESTHANAVRRHRLRDEARGAAKPKYFPTLPPLDRSRYRLNTKRRRRHSGAGACRNETRGERNHGQDRIAGSTKEVTGAAKEAVGKIIGDAKLQNDGKTEKSVGKIQNAIGGVNDAVRDALKTP